MKVCRRMRNKWSFILDSRRLIILILLLAGVIYGNAQVNSDTVTANDSAVIAPPLSETHANDSSQNFFNWKRNVNQPYSQNKLGSRVHADNEVAKLKKSDEFW